MTISLPLLLMFEVAVAGPRLENACLLDAVSEVAAGYGVSVPPRELARRVVLYPDGVDPFDVLRALPAFGLEGLAFEASAREVGRFAAAVGPVVVFSFRGAAKHAEVVRTPREARWEGLRQVMLVRPVGARDPRGLAKVLERARREDARFRARAWLLRAAEHGEAEGPRAKAQVLLLLERAAAADPSWEEARRLLDRAGSEAP